MKPGIRTFADAVGAVRIGHHRELLVEPDETIHELFGLLVMDLHPIPPFQELYTLFNIGDECQPSASARGIAGDRQSVVSGKSVSVRVDIGGSRIIKTKINQM